MYIHLLFFLIAKQVSSRLSFMTLNGQLCTLLLPVSRLYTFIKSSDINQKGIRIPINCYTIYYNGNYEKYFWLPIQNKWFNKKLNLKQSFIGSICIHHGLQSSSTPQPFLPHLSHHTACKPSVLCWAPAAPCSTAPSRKAVPPFPSFLTPISEKPNQN